MRKLLKKQNLETSFFVLMITLAYLPMFSGVMGIKSDALTVSYPIYHYLANQLQQGNIPFWHYNLNGGFPIHADPGSLFWNFPLWIFPFIGKSLYVYILLIVVHIAIAAVGMYKLGRYLQLSKAVAGFMMFCYVCSGYYVAHLQHPNNILESAWIPFVILFFFKTVFSHTTRNVVYLAISLFFLINAGYPGCPISTTWFLAVLFIGILVFNKNARQRKFLWPAVKHLFFAALLAAILSSPFLLSFYEIHDLYFRSSTFSAVKIANAGGMTIRSLLSIFWPAAGSVSEAFYKTDIAWNNVYCGILLFAFFLLAVFKVKHHLKKPLLLAGLFLLLLSFQGYSKVLLFDYLPLLGLVRNNGSFRIYFLLPVIIIGALGVESWINKSSNTLKRLLSLFITIQLFAILLILMTYHGKLLPDWKNQAISGAFLINKLSPYLLIVLQSFLNIALLSASLFFLRNKKKVLWLLSIDVLLSFFINLPFTGLSLKSNAYLQSEISKAVELINKPVSIAADTLGNIHSPSKYITAPAHFLENSIRIDYSNYPAMFKSYSQLLSNGGTSKYSRKHVAFYTSGSPGNYISHYSIQSNTISFTANLATRDSVLLFQHYTRNWKCLQDGKPVAITPNRDGFICVPVQAGVHTIIFRYRPTRPITAFFISLFVWTLLLIYLLPKKFMQRIPFTPKLNSP